MHAEFVVKSCFGMPGLGVVASGEVTEGYIEEGAQGKNYAGRIITVVRMDIKGIKVQTAKFRDKVNIVMKGVSASDIHIGMTIHFF